MGFRGFNNYNCYFRNQILRKSSSKIYENEETNYTHDDIIRYIKSNFNCDLNICKKEFFNIRSKYQADHHDLVMDADIINLNDPSKNKVVATFRIDLVGNHVYNDNTYVSNEKTITQQIYIYFLNQKTIVVRYCIFRGNQSQETLYECQIANGKVVGSRINDITSGVSNAAACLCVRRVISFVYSALSTVGHDITSILSLPENTFDKLINASKTFYDKHCTNNLITL